MTRAMKFLVWLLCFGLAIFLGLVITTVVTSSSQTWETNREFWNRMKVKAVERRLDHLEDRMARQERPQRGDSLKAGSSVIRPRRRSLEARVKNLESVFGSVSWQVCTLPEHSVWDLHYSLEVHNAPEDEADGKKEEAEVELAPDPKAERNR